MQLHLTFESLIWDPTLTLYEEQEAAMTNYSGHVMTKTCWVRGHIGNLVIKLLSSLTTDLADVTHDNNFYCVLASNVQMLSIETSLNEHICLRKTMSIDPQTLAAQWMISPERAKRTVEMTAQRGVRTFLHSTLSQHFPIKAKCFGTNMFYIPCLVTQCLLGPCLDKAIKWPKHTPLPLVGHVLIL
jgi:hypothetical protein